MKEALQDAMETATQNVPAIAGKVWILPDVSGSMQSPVTGYRPGSATAVRCLDVAALAVMSLSSAQASFRGMVAQRSAMFAAQKSGKPAIIPSIAGWARMTGYNTIFIDDRDPFAHGFVVK